MTNAINNLASSLAGAQGSIQSASKKKAAKEADTARRRADFRDTFVASVDQVEQVDAIRHLADADQEEAREDREERQLGYRPPSKPQSPHGRLDLNA